MSDIIKNAQYIKDEFGKNMTIKAEYNGEKIVVPLVVGNRHYDEIMHQVEAKVITIAKADEE